MRRFLCLGICILTGWMLLPARSALAQAMPSADRTVSATQPVATLDQLLAALSADDWQTREDAAQRLRQRPASDLPRLRKEAATIADVDARTAVVVAIAEIKKAESASASAVTLDLADAPAADVLKALAGQVRFAIVADPSLLEGRRLSASIHNQPFWLAMRDIAPSLGLAVEASARNPGRLALVAGGPSVVNRYSATAGPFVITPLQSVGEISLDISSGRPVVRGRGVNLTLAVAQEPGLPARNMTLKLEQVLDDRDQSLLLSPPPAFQVGGNQIGISDLAAERDTCVIRLSPASTSSRIKLLRGILTYHLPLGLRHEEAAIQAERNAPSIVAVDGKTIEAVLKGDASKYELRLRVPDQNSSRFRFLLLDANNLPLANRSGRMLGATNQFLEYVMTFQGGGVDIDSGKPLGPPARLRVSIPGEYREVHERFELKDVPLPRPE